METGPGFEYDFLKGVFYTCSVCSYAWRTRTHSEPRSCPHCGTRLWRESFHHECIRCGHKWITSRVSAKKCPSCQSADWNVTNELYIPDSVTDTQKRMIIDRYGYGIGAVGISRELGITFSDVFDVIRQANPDKEVVL